MKLNYKRVLLVGFAFMIIQAFWIAYDAIVPLMLVNKFGMNQTWSGIIMTFDNVLAVFLLPIFGTLSDKSKSKMGKRKPFVLIGTICAVIAFFALSFVDYHQLQNLGEQVELPQAYESTEQSVVAHEYFWNENYEIINNEHNEYADSERLDNGLSATVKIQDYVSNIIYGKNFSELTQTQQGYAKEWYLNIDLNMAFVLTESGYDIYKITQDGVSLMEYEGDNTYNLTPLSEEEGKIAKSISAANAYSVLVTPARSAYAQNVTVNNPWTLVVFMVVLLLTLISMAIFRSPAVALMPDVVVRPMRSTANALINLMGGVGSVSILALGMVIGTDNIENQVMPYMGYIAGVCIVMIIGLIVFMLTVKEPKWSAEMLESQAEIDAKNEVLERERAITADQSNEDATGADGVQTENTAKKRTGKLTKGELISLILILASVAFWYMGYNAVTSKYSLYAINVLGKPYNAVLIVAQVVGAISFIPIGLLGKIGRRKMILIGVMLLFLAFLGAIFVHRGSPDWILYIVFSVAGVGWAAINVNSFPMVVELASETTIGKFTGYYYTASMAAQILTPIISGVIMDLVGSMKPLFVYGAICVALSFVTMIFVRHGDSKPIGKKSALEMLGAAGDD